MNNAGALVASFDERGLGNENVDYTLRADATATYACINKGETIRRRPIRRTSTAT